jgi:hypothetical protein
VQIDADPDLGPDADPGYQNDADPDPQHCCLLTITSVVDPDMELVCLGQIQPNQSFQIRIQDWI